MTEYEIKKLTLFCLSLYLMYLFIILSATIAMYPLYFLHYSMDTIISMYLHSATLGLSFIIAFWLLVIFYGMFEEFKEDPIWDQKSLWPKHLRPVNLLRSLLRSLLRRKKDIAITIIEAKEEDKKTITTDSDKDRNLLWPEMQPMPKKKEKHKLYQPDEAMKEIDDLIS